MNTQTRQNLLFFSRNQIAAAAATLIDFLIFIALVELTGMAATLAVALGAFSGGVFNFSCNRKWTFNSSNNVTSEATRYGFVWAGSLGLNIGLFYILNSFDELSYVLSRITVVLFVALFWNYPLHRYWVFAKNETR